MDGATEQKILIVCTLKGIMYFTLKNIIKIWKFGKKDVIDFFAVFYT